MSRVTGKPAVIALGVLGAGILLVGAGRTWVTGTVDDAVLGASRVTGSGTDVVPGLVALALTAAAAAVASTTSGRVVRVLTLVIEGLAALALGALVVRVLVDPSGVLGRVAATSTGRTGSIETHAAAGAWPWLALVAAVLLLVSAALGLAGSRRWKGLSSRYDAPASDADASRRGPRGERVASDWDRLNAGDDPTME